LTAPTFVRCLAPALVSLAFVGLRLTEADLAGKQLTAVAHSSEAEYLKNRIDEALVGITASQEWRQVEDGYFGPQQ
jgi:hypothetical protein